MLMADASPPPMSETANTPDPDCERVDALMEGALDNSVMPQTTEFIRRHMARCTGCQSRWELTSAWHQLTQTSLMTEVPPDLAERLRKQLRGSGDDG